jgi:hypothetical protein
MPDDNIDEKETSDTNLGNLPPKFAWWKRIEWWGVISWDGILTIATIVLAIYTYRLWVETHKLAVEAEKTSVQQAEDTQRSLTLTEKAANAAIESAAAAKMLASAAKDTAETAKRSFFVAQRPFVFVSIFEAHVIGNELRILPKFENGGSTQAVKFQSWVSWKLFPNEPPAHYSWPDLDASGRPLPKRGDGPVSFLGPKAASYAIGLNVPLSDLERVRQGEQRLFLWGWTDYSDTIGGRSRYRTEFAHEVVVADIGKDDAGKTTVVLAFPKYGRNKAN